jgi:peptide/nickel transport system permease protein
MRLMDVLLAFPALLLAIAIVSVLARGLQSALLAIAIVSYPGLRARGARQRAVRKRAGVYRGSRVRLGRATLSSCFKHILPNSVPPLIVAATLGIASAILDAAALSFLGLGAQPPMAEWGSMLGAERNQVFTAPHLVFFPGIAIMITVLAFNLLGDGLRDAIDPRLSQSGY